jgi:hypothetical protein
MTTYDVENGSENGSGKRGEPESERSRLNTTNKSWQRAFLLCYELLPGLLTVQKSPQPTELATCVTYDFSCLGQFQNYLGSTCTT